MTLSVDEALALAVLRGDKVAAYALADRLLDERQGGGAAAEVIRHRETYRHNKPDSYEMYHWPEFQALAKRLGIPLGLATTNLTIRLPLDETVEVIHEYLATDTSTPPVPTGNPET